MTPFDSDRVTLGAGEKIILAVLNVEIAGRLLRRRDPYTTVVQLYALP